MVEADHKRHLVSGLRAAGCHVTRFEDRFTAGIPDLHVAYRRTAELWLEVKLTDYLLTPWRWEALKLQQVVLCEQLSQHAVGDVLFLAYSPKAHLTLLVNPTALLHAVRTHTVLLDDTLEGKAVPELLQLLEDTQL